MTSAIWLLKALQLAVSVGVIALTWLIYPGVMAVVATLVGGCYTAACVLALADKRIGIWAASLLTGLTAVLSTLAIGRFERNGFSFLSGSYESHSAFYAVPYLFLLVSLGSLLALVLYAVCWRWLLLGHRLSWRR